MLIVYVWQEDITHEVHLQGIGVLQGRPSQEIRYHAVTDLLTSYLSLLQCEVILFPMFLCCMNTRLIAMECSQGTLCSLVAIALAQPYIRLFTVSGAVALALKISKQMQKTPNTVNSNNVI
jgi:hypothetical protein